jgi:hypothetical protein
MVPHTHHVRDPPQAGVLLRRSHRRHLRIGKHRVRHEPGGHGPQVLGMQDVVPHSAGPGVGHVLELEVVGGITQRPDPGTDVRYAWSVATWPCSSSSRPPAAASIRSEFGRRSSGGGVRPAVRAGRLRRPPSGNPIRIVLLPTVDPS